MEITRGTLKLFRNVKTSDVAPSAFIFFSILLTAVLNQLYTEKITDLFLTTVITEAHEIYPSCELKCCKVNESL